jgi:hypothetical protein
MRWSHVCNSGMYRSGLLFAISLMWVIGCSKPAEKSPPAEPEAKTQEAEKPEVAKTEETKEEKEESAKTEAPKPLLVENVGFKTPESIYYDEKNDVYLVSNINGSPDGVDNNGFISKVSPEGSVIELTWIVGGKNDVTLNSPKGMTVKDDVLYVTDINTVRMFDMASGAPKGEIAIKKATFLNDLALGPEGTIYVSDSGLKSGEDGLQPTGSDAIWTIKKGKAKKLIASKELNQPNGLLADEEGVWVVTFGGTELYRVTSAGKREPAVTIPSGSLDGVVRTKDGNLLISSWKAQAVFQGKPDGAFAPVIAGVTSPADLGYDAKRNRVLVPIFQKDAIQIQQLGQATAGLRADAPDPEIAAEKAEADEKAKDGEEAAAEKDEAAKPAAAKKGDAKPEKGSPAKAE